jgi:lipopolysaccharide heptosyltransferase II
VKNILLIKLSSIGDVLSTTPCFRALKKHLPQVKLSLIVERESFDLVKNNPYLDKIFIFDRTELSKSFCSFFRLRRALVKFFHLIKELKKEEFDLVLDFQGLLRSVFFLYLARAKYKICRGNFLGVDERTSKTQPLLAVENYLSMLRKLGIKGASPELEIFLGPADRQFAQDFFSRHQISGRDLVIILNPATRWPTKTWPQQNFIELAQRLITHLGAKIILIGSKDELETSLTIQKAIRNNIFLATGKTSLTELAALIKKSELLITGDTGPMHLAAAVKAKTIALFGPTNPQRTGPVNPNATIIQKKFPCLPCYKRKCKTIKCMKAISSEEVLKEAKKMLGDNFKK